MIICVIIGEKQLLGTETRSWTTSHFTWGEGNQETDHELTITRYLTEISVFVDDVQSYLSMNGLTDDAVLDEIPNPSYYLSLSKLTGLNIKSDILPRLEGKFFAYVGAEAGANDKQRYFSYRKIELSPSCDGLTLIRKIKAYTTDQHEEVYR